MCVLYSAFFLLVSYRYLHMDMVKPTVRSRIRRSKWSVPGYRVKAQLLPVEEEGELYKPWGFARGEWSFYDC